MSQPVHDEDSLDPAESLRLIADQQRHVNRKLGGDPLLYWGPWGVAWTIGFGLLTLRYGLGDGPIVDMPSWIPLTVLFTLMAAAMVVTTHLGSRTAKYTVGASNVQGLMYGLTWAFAFLGVVAVAVRFGRDLPEDETGLLWAALSVGVTGVLYMAGAAIWREWSMFAMGLFLSVVNAVGVSVGPGWHALLTSLAGLVLLVGGIVLHFRSRAVS